MRALAASLPAIADQAKRVSATAALDSLFQDTPADTSTLISNWRVSTGAVEAPIPAHALGVKGSTREASAGIAKALAGEAINALPPGAPIVIYNSVPYGRYVNDGTSSQAPRLFLEKARLAARLAATAFKRSVGVKRG
jgi:hypothetical protein